MAHIGPAVKLVERGTVVECFFRAAPALSSRPMYSHEMSLRVRYAETDRMGYVYYGTYAQYFEVGRVEALRSLGLPYRRMEEDGVMLPVHDMKVEYRKPAYYDDLLTVRTSIVELPSVRIRFAYAVFNEAGELITEALTTLVFIDRATNKPRRAPDALLAALEPFFSQPAA